MVEETADTGKTKYFSDLSKSRFGMMKIARAGEILGTVRDRQEGKDIWRNVSEHELVQAAACEALGELLGWARERISRLVDAALVHDWDKKYQSSGLRKLNGQVASGEITEEQGGKAKYNFFDESEEHSVKGLEKLNVDPELIKIASSDGHPAISRVTNPNSLLDERVFHYIGSITDQDKIVPLDERLDNLEKNDRYKMMNEYGRQVSWTGGLTLYETQRAVGHQIEKEIVGMLVERETTPSNIKSRLESNPKELPLVIRETVEAKYS